MKTVQLSERDKLDYMVLYVVCGCIRLFLSIFLGIHHCTTMMIWDLVSSLFYFGSLFPIYKSSKRSYWLYLFVFEVLLSTVVHNVIFGWGVGFSLYAMIMTIAFFFMCYYKKDNEKLVRQSVMHVIMFYVIVVISNFIGGEYSRNNILDSDAIGVLHAVNTWICYGCITYLCARFLDLVIKKQNHLHSMNQELHDRIVLDPLTGCYNRTGFYEKATELLQQNKETKYCIVCSDIKDFKLINDIFGENVGDQVLQMQANLMQKSIREDAVFGRLASDKFALCMPHDRYSEEQFVANVNKLQNTYSTQRYRLMMHIGVYEIQDVEEPIGTMCDKAFLAIKTIKDSMQKTVAFYNQALVDDFLRKKELVSGLDEAIAQKQIKMFLQAQTDKNGNLLGAEALVRWQHPELGMLYPGSFVEHFEEVGVIYRMDEYIWRAAAQKLREWKDRGLPYYISVNISQKDFYFLDVYKTIVGIVDEFGIEKGKLRLEITESTFSEEQNATQEAITKLHEDGFTIEIDDFGSGYSSLRFLQDVCADVVKIDREFLRESSNAGRGKSILGSVISLSKEIEMGVVAEGVETIEQVEMVADMGCECYQGYYFAKPCSVEDFEKKYSISLN